MTLLPLLLALAPVTPPDAAAQAAPAVAAAPSTAEASDRLHQDPATGARAVVPAGWHLHAEVKDRTKALFVTKQNIRTEGGFLTGFTLNQVDGFRAAHRIAPSEYAAGFVSVMAARFPGSRTATLTPRPGLTVHEVRVLDDTRLPVTKLLYLLVGDDARDRLQIAWFETPEATSDTEWPRGDRILRAFLEGVAQPPTD